MSAIPIRDGNGYTVSGHRIFQQLRESDLRSLPGVGGCAVGSMAYLQDFSKAWILGEDNVWHEF